MSLSNILSVLCGSMLMTKSPKGNMSGAIQFVRFLLIVCPALAVAQQPETSVWDKIRQQLPENSGIRVQVLHDEVVRVTRLDGVSFMVDLADFGPRAREMAANGDTAKRTIRFNLAEIDTAGFAGRFRLVARVPILPALVADSDQDGMPELVGSFKDYNTNTNQLPSRIYEKFAPDIHNFQIAYEDTNLGFPILSGDINQNGLPEIAWLQINYDSLGNYRGRNLVFYESARPGQLATTFIFFHRIFERYAVWMFPRITDLDQDGKMEVIYYGDDYYTGDNPGTKTFIAEYNDSTQTLERLKGDFGRSGDWAVGDFDQDGLMEFVWGNFDGQVFVMEHTGKDNDYALTFIGQVAISRAALYTEGNDIDGDGRPEFFVSGRGYKNGLWTNVITCFETIGDNQFEKTVQIEFSGLGSFYTLSSLNHGDITGDGKDEILFADGATLIVLHATGDDDYEILWMNSYRIGIGELFISTGYISNAAKRNLIVSREEWNEADTKTRYLADILEYDVTTGIADCRPSFSQQVATFTNYPNPFNISTTIRWQQKSLQRVTLSIYDLTGKEVMRLINNQNMARGIHQIIWIGKNGQDGQGGDAASGIYFVKLQIGQQQRVRKILLVK